MPGCDVTWIERSGRPIAAVVHDAELADQQRFIQAAGDAAVMRLEQAQLLADLRASTADLAASRLRLVETAQAERQRIERDLHDSVQQDLLGLRLRLDLATEAVGEDPSEARRMIARVGTQLDGVLDSVRALARGVYPRVLQDHGLVEAVRSAARRSPHPVSVRTSHVCRYDADVEVAVYFCCLEALQNSAKHAGSSAASEVRFWQDAKALRFEVADSGAGFNPGLIESSNGLASMHDRIEAIGGTLTITSRQGQGTVVRGRIPTQPLFGR